MADEEGHIDFLETQLELHDRIGAENYAQLNATKMEAVEE
jgi:bacterioferritin